MSDEISNDVLSAAAADAEVVPDDTSVDTSSGDFDWKSHLSDDQRSHGDIKGAESLQDLASRFIDQRATISRSVMIPSGEAGAEELGKFYEKLEKIPGVTRIPDNDDKEGWTKFYQRIGVPAEPDNYAIEDKDLAGKLHKLNLNGGQAEAVARMIGESAQTVKDKLETQISDGLGLLKSEWGDGNFERRAQAASMALREIGGNSIFDMLSDTGLANHPEMIKFGFNLSKMLGENKVTVGDTTAKFGTSKEEAQQSIDSIFQNQADPYHDKTHPDHDARVKTMEQYFKIIAS